MLNCLIVGLGGFIGAVGRYLIGLIPLREDFVFPVKTLAVNLIGALFIGILAAVAAKHPQTDPRLLLFLKVGICGGFTTFSTFALESVDLLKAEHPALAALYIALSILFGIAAVFAGQAVVR